MRCISIRTHAPCISVSCKMMPCKGECRQVDIVSLTWTFFFPQLKGTVSSLSVSGIAPGWHNSATACGNAAG